MGWGEKRGRGGGRGVAAFEPRGAPGDDTCACEGCTIIQYPMHANMYSTTWSASLHVCIYTHTQTHTHKHTHTNTHTPHTHARAQACPGRVCAKSATSPAALCQRNIPPIQSKGPARPPAAPAAPGTSLPPPSAPSSAAAPTEPDANTARLAVGMAAGRRSGRKTRNCAFSRRATTPPWPDPTAVAMAGATLDCQQWPSKQRPRMSAVPPRRDSWMLLSHKNMSLSVAALVN